MYSTKFNIQVLAGAHHTNLRQSPPTTHTLSVRHELWFKSHYEVLDIFTHRDTHQVQE